MKHISEYMPETSGYEVLVHLTEKIIAGEIVSFRELAEYASVLPEDKSSAAILKKAFDILKQTHWGFFKDISPEAFPALWAEVVIVAKGYPFAGDLKRNMSLPEVFIGLIDIHGYTAYCQNNRFNLSKLDLLDRMIQEDVRKLAASMGVVARRSRGDEILLLGAQAADVLETVLAIIEYFSGRKLILDGIESVARSDREIVLPEFKVSAGLAGGQKFTSLIITRDGDLSGDLVNTAARLQARANRISPSENRVLITSHVHQRLKDSLSGRKRLARAEFFNAGTVEFTGTTVQLYDLIFADREAHRLQYVEAMDSLYDSLKKGAWKSKIFIDSMLLADAVLSSLPAPRAADVGAQALSCDALRARVNSAITAFETEKFEQAIAIFGLVIKELPRLAGMDEVVLSYLRSIYANYASLAASFTEELERDVQQHLDSILSLKDREIYKSVTKQYEGFAKTLEAARLEVRNRKAIWYRLIAACGDELDVRINSKK